MAIPIDRDVPDPTGWVAYCPACDQDREVQRARVRDAETGTVYFELVCAFCHLVLLTFRRKASRSAAT